MSDKFVLYSVADGVATIAINRPDRRNALNGQVIANLIDAFGEAEKSIEVKTVMITGAGDKAFSAGGDLAPSGGGGFKGMHDDRGLYADLLLQLSRLKKPLVGRINGHALGGGLGLAVSCDIAIAAENALLGTPEVKVGLFPMMILAVLCRNIPRKKALEMFLTGQRLPAAEAAQIGMITRAVAADKLDEEVAAVTKQLCALSPATLALGRRAVYASQDMPFDAQLNYLHSMLSVNTLLEDVAEGVSAFFEKRDPNFKGK